jgi:hypothetical protein
MIVVTPEKQLLVSLGMPGVPGAQRRANIIKIAEAVVSRL